MKDAGAPGTPQCTRGSGPSRAAMVAAVIVFTCAGLIAKDARLNYLKDAWPDTVALLAAPPGPDSPEQAADLETVRAVYHAASSNDIAAAYSEKKFSVFNFSTEVGPYFQSNSLPKTTAFFQKIQSDAAMVADVEKDYFMRPRPYTIDTNLANGKLEKSFGFPSGHSTESMVLAVVLADLVPDNRDAILAHARSIGWHRVQIARHYPSDIYAGRVLAQAIIRHMKQSPAFQRDFAEVKTELARAKD